MPIRKVISRSIEDGATASADLAAGSVTPAKIQTGVDFTFNSLTIGKGAGSIATNTAVGASALAANTTGSSSVAVGNGALVAQTSGDRNVAVGESALSTNITGVRNTAVGHVALAANTASYNTAFGGYALFSNTTANNNTAVGYQAGYSNQTGDNMVAVGRLAAYTNSTGANITAIGNEALRYTTIGNNTAVGAAALRNNSTGQYNVAVGQHDATGYPTLYSNTTGSYNTAMGSGALCSNTTASYNTAFGYQAGYSSQTADYNTFIGYYAGRSTTGDQNTFVGKFAGNAVTTGTLNTIIGAYNGNQGGLDIRTASNYIVLSDGGGNPRGIFDNSGRFLVGTTSANGLGTTISGATHIQNSSDASDTLNSFRYQGTQVGSITRSTVATAYNTSSDYRLKNSIAPMTGALAKVAALKPVTYKWNADGSDGEGFIAHELQAVCPQAVTGEKDAVDDEGNPKYQGIDTSFLVATLTAAIQELKTQNDAMKARLDAAGL